MAFTVPTLIPEYRTLLPFINPLTLLKLVLIEKVFANIF